MNELNKRVLDLERAEKKTNDDDQQRKPESQGDRKINEKIIPVIEEKLGDKKQNTDASRLKLRHGLKHVPKAGKTIVPQPFSLSTDRRRERRSCMDISSVSVDKYAPKLAKSASFMKRTKQRPNAREALDLKRRATTTATSSRPKFASNEAVVKKTEKQSKKSENDNLQKSSTFKARPLPSFYHRKDRTSIPEKQMSNVTSAKSASLGPPEDMNSASSNTGTNKNKIAVTRKIGNSAKETLNKFIKRTTRILSTTNKETSIATSA